MKNFLSLYFPLLVLSSLLSFFPFYILNSTNYELLHHLKQTLCFHMNRSTPLLKTHIADHYPRINNLQHVVLSVVAGVVEIGMGIGMGTAMGMTIVPGVGEWQEYLKCGPA